MKILHVLNHILEAGNGIVNIAIDLACLQAQSGHTVAIASAGGEYESILENFGVKHFYLNQERTVENIVKVGFNYRKIAHSFQPHIVHAHMITGVIVAKSFKYGLNYKLVSTIHNEFQKAAIFMGLADSVITVSNAVAASMVSRGIPLHKIHVVRNGVTNSPRRNFSSEDNIEPLNRPSITTVAGMYQRKGVYDLVEAFSLIAQDFPSAHLYMIGDGPDREDLEKSIKRSPLTDRIHFEGFQKNPYKYLLSSDIFVLASHSETFGLSIAEAREAGCAIVASNIGGIPETLDNGSAGIMFPVKDIKSLSAILNSLLSDHTYLEEMKQKSQQNLDWLSVQRVSEETLEIYSHLK
jgi:glycosyltransferase involved in cell wall biosynthesis